MAVSAIDVIAPAFERTTRQLFRPFRFGQWVRLAIVGLLAAEMTAGGCNARFPFGGPGVGGNPFPAPGGVNPFPGLSAPFSGHALLFALGGGLLLLLGFAFAIVFAYIGSRMRFVLFDSVVAGECHVRQFWGQRGVPAFRYFVFQIIFILCSIVGILLLFGIPVLVALNFGWFANPRAHGLSLFLLILTVLVLFILFISTLVLIQVLIKDFVVPQMALDGVTVSEGWRRLVAMMRGEKGGYAIYIGMKVVLSIASGIVLGLATLAAVLVLLIPFGGVGVFAVIAGHAAGLTWNPATIAIAIVAALVAILIFLMLSALIAVPAIVFFPSYSVLFFAERYPPLQTAITTSRSPA